MNVPIIGGTMLFTWLESITYDDRLAGPCAGQHTNVLCRPRIEILAVQTVCETIIVIDYYDNLA